MVLFSGGRPEPILMSLRNPILRLAVPEEVKRKSSKQRKEIRNEKLRLYFKDSNIQIIDCEAPFDFTRRIVGLYGQRMFLGLGIATDRDADRLKVVTPVREKADKVEFSSVKSDRRL